MNHNDFPATQPAITPAYVTIENWCRLSGMSRSGTYNALAQPDGLIARKVGARTLIPVQDGLRWMASRPAATFRAPKQRSAS